jgi:hypothetical protein
MAGVCFRKTCCVNIAMLTLCSPSTYALTLTREDVMVWIMNHDVSEILQVLRIFADTSR